MNHAEMRDMLEAMPVELSRALSETIARTLAVLRVPPPMRLSVWFDEFFYFSKESSYLEGRQPAWPPQRGMMDMMGHQDVHHFTSRKSARVGYTKMLLAHTCWEAEHKRRNAVIYQPTDEDRDDFVTTELEPVLRDVKIMRKVMPRFTRRSKDNTLKKKAFTTGQLHLRGGKAAKNYRRLTVDTVKYDEFSGFDRDIEKEGSPGKLGDKRLEGAMYPKSIAGSTPKVKFNDNTEDREAEADAHLRWHVPCWHCHELHEITFGGKKAAHGLKWRNDDPTTVEHICPHCGVGMNQRQYLEVWEAGVWIDIGTGAWLDSGRIPNDVECSMRTPASLDWRVCELPEHVDPATIAPMPGHVSMPIWTACAPQATWQTIVEEWLAAVRLAERGDKSLLKTFVNTTLGETWEEKGEAADEHELQKRAEAFPLCIVPVGAILLTAGGDIQGNRAEFGVWGWNRGESWTIDHHIIEFNPQADEDWDMVEAYILRRFPQAWHGGTLPIEAVSIDANYQTQAVLNFVRRMQAKGHFHIRAVRGEGDPAKPIKGPANSQDVTWRGQKWPNGVKLWQVGTKQAKDLVHGQLELVKPGPGYVHTSHELKKEWYEQLTAEQRVPVTTPTGTQERWIKRRPRNEVLDTRVYATHAYYCLGAHAWTDKRWDQQQQAVQPPRDLFSSAAAAPAAPPALVAQAVGQAEPKEQVAPMPAAPAQPQPDPNTRQAQRAAPAHNQRPTPRGW